MGTSILGTSVRRVEDPALLTGASRYVGDLPIEGVLAVAFVRSPLAHARVRGVDVGPAREAPGVVAAFAADDLDLPPTPAFMVLNRHVERPPLATDAVRFVGDVLAVVVAATQAQAVDAAELVELDLEPLAAVVDAEAALAEGAPLLFPALGSNLAAGQRDAAGADVLADAELVVRGRFVNQRIAVVPMEGNAIAVVPGDDGDGHDLTIYVSTQMPHGFWQTAERVLGLPTATTRVVAPAVGGGFGGKAGMSAEHVVCIEVARRLGRPVRWVEGRSENLQGAPHGRGQVQYVELGLRRDGAITGMRCRVVGDSGAYAGFGGALAMGPTRTMAQGVYRIPKIAYDVAVALTTTTPMGAFRGAGRPEATAFLERILDLAADELDLDPAELRRRNLLQPGDLPLTTLTGASYDCGDYPAALERALEASGYDDLRAEQARRRDAGDRTALGIGLCTYVEITGGGGGGELGSVVVHDDGTATVMAGTSSHGQGHATAFTTLVADRLGLPPERIRFVQSDTAAVPRGGGTGGSRSLQLGGSSVWTAAGEVLDAARALAADLLEAAADDVVVVGAADGGPAGGGLGVAGVPAKAIGWDRLAAEATTRGGELRSVVDLVQDGATFPFGAHVAVVEVDLDTGKVRLVRHVAVDDCGRVLNPLLVQGQQHGGIAQGVAQVLWEEVAYDADGNPLTSTLADYGMPSAAELPSFETVPMETPTPLNPLGAKGIGESGTVGSMPAVQNAVVDALSHLGVRHVDLPCTPERVWRAIQAAEAGTPEDPWREPPAVFATLPERAAANRPAAADVDI